MYCTNCGNKNDFDSEFCTSCGIKLSNKKKKNKIEDVLFVPEKKSHTFRNIILTIGVVGVLLILVVAFASSSDTSTNTQTDTTTVSNNENTDNWIPFTSVEHYFKIDFPKYPTTERIPEDKTDGITYSGTQYITEDDDNSAYLAQVADYDIKPEDYDNKTGLEGMVNYMFNSKDYKITNSFFTKFNNYDAIEFTFNQSTDNFVGKGVAFIRDDLNNIKAFILMVMSQNYLTPNYEKFINSFQLN